eukprot:863121_1
MAEPTCTTSSIIPRWVTTAFGSTYGVLLTVVSVHSFRFLMKFNPTFAKKSTGARFKMWIRDVWQRRRCYIPLLTHLFDQVTDISVAIQFWDLAETKSANDWEACNGLNMWYLAILTILSMAIYRLISSYLIYKATKGSLGRFILQMLDCELFRALYINYLCDNTEPCSPQRWITALEAALESTPQALIQMIYLIKTNTFTESWLVVVSLVSSLWSITSKLVSDDKSTVVKRAKRLNFKCSPIAILLDFLYYLVKFIAYVLAISLTIACCPIIFCCCCICALLGGGVDSDDIAEVIDEFKELGDSHNHFAWISIFYLMRVSWRILDVSSRIFLLTLIWIIIGGTALTVIVAIEGVVLLILCIYTNEWELLFGITALVISTATERSKAISKYLGFYRTITNWILMVLMTVWLYVDFDCPRCTEYHDEDGLRGTSRESLAQNPTILWLFAYCWIAVFAIPIIVTGLLKYDIFVDGTSTSRNLNKMIKANDFDGILEMQLYAGTLHVYDTNTNRTLLMLAVQTNRSVIVSHLIKGTNEDQQWHRDQEGNGILNYLYDAVKSFPEADYTLTNKVLNTLSNDATGSDNQFVLQSSSTKGASYGDTKRFDHEPLLKVNEFEGLKLNMLKLSRLYLSEIVYWTTTQPHEGGICVSGIQCKWIVYNDRGDPILKFSSDDVPGTQHNPKRNSYVLGLTDFFSEVDVQSRHSIQSIRLSGSIVARQLIFGHDPPNTGDSESQSIAIPHNHIVIGFHGGTGGHLHNIGVITLPFKDSAYSNLSQGLLHIILCNSSQEFPSKVIDVIIDYLLPPLAPPKFLQVQSSPAKGRTHADTIQFDHHRLLAGEMLKLSRLCLSEIVYWTTTQDWDGGICVSGIQCKWTLYNDHGDPMYELSSDEKYGSDHEPKRNSLVLGLTDFFYDVSVLSNKAIRSIRLNGSIVTTLGRDPGLAHFIDNLVPNNHIVIGFHGGTGAHLHNIGVVTLPFEDSAYSRSNQGLLHVILSESAQEFPSNVIDVIIDCLLPLNVNRKVQESLNRYDPLDVWEDNIKEAISQMEDNVKEANQAISQEIMDLIEHYPNSQEIMDLIEHYPNYISIDST